MKSTTMVITILLAGVSILRAQTDICYSYDAAGNRTKREKCCATCWFKEDTEIMELSSVTPQEQSTLKVFPNPSTGRFQLSGPDVPLDAQVRVMNMSGVLVLERQLGDGHFDLSNLPAGIYVLNVQYGSTRKAIVLDKTRQ
jgi:Secretion system C-terminal sorting domain